MPCQSGCRLRVRPRARGERTPLVVVVGRPLPRLGHRHRYRMRILLRWGVLGLQMRRRLPFLL